MLVRDQVLGIVLAPPAVLELAERLAAQEPARHRAVAAVGIARRLGQDLVKELLGHRDVALQGIVVLGVGGDFKIFAAERHDDVVGHVVPRPPVEVGRDDLGPGRELRVLGHVELDALGGGRRRKRKCQEREQRATAFHCARWRRGRASRGRGSPASSSRLRSGWPCRSRCAVGRRAGRTAGCSRTSPRTPAADRRSGS